MPAAAALAAPPGRWSRLRDPLAVAATVGALTLALQLRDPHQHGSWGLCPFKLLTGWDCPFCGGLRAVNDLGDVHLLDAVQSNLLFVTSLPLIVAAWLYWFGGRWTGRPRRVGAGTSRRIIAAYVVLGLAFTIFRNTPWGQPLFVS
jgi:hypothetical protein